MNNAQCPKCAHHLHGRCIRRFSISDRPELTTTEKVFLRWWNAWDERPCPGFGRSDQLTQILADLEAWCRSQ